MDGDPIECGMVRHSPRIRHALETRLQRISEGRIGFENRASTTDSGAHH